MLESYSIRFGDWLISQLNCVDFWKFIWYLGRLVDSVKYLEYHS